MHFCRVGCERAPAEPHTLVDEPAQGHTGQLARILARPGASNDETRLAGGLQEVPLRGFEH
ncbi:MAG: hypothetical protein QOE67_846 [Solirubrobacteraceae bacterium]|jgi:hypothetical protein|nr:hypothetical protein [Solirubrobacteraceae bacterium]MEA2283145.1 hypothetical protein [Solirubrobacteraceae bacterium]